MKLKDMAGTRIEKLFVIERAESLKDGTATWKCLCDCGQERIIAGTGLRARRHKRCGCAAPRFNAKDKTTHGMSRTRTYNIWARMKQRCSDKSFGKARRLYFGKGIRVCEDWMIFEHFFRDMGEAPIGFSIERKDGNGNYSPSNCKWATTKEQANNTTRNFKIIFKNKSQTVSQWANELKIKPNTLLYRLRRGWPMEKALKTNDA